MNVQVLIADDEALIRQSTKAVLLEEGFQTTEAASGAETWRRFREERPDVVLLDLPRSPTAARSSSTRSGTWSWAPRRRS